MGWDWWPFDDGEDLPRSGADVGVLVGSPGGIRASALMLRNVEKGMGGVRAAAGRLERVKSGESWKGQAFEAFREAITKSPTVADVDNAKLTMQTAAGVLERLADAIEDCQSRWNSLRQELDRLAVPTSGDMPGALKPQVESIKSQLDTVHGNYKVYLGAAARDFDTLDDKPKFAKDKSGADYWLKATAHNVGDFFEGIWAAFTELGGALKSLWELRKISQWDDRWDEFWKVLQYAADDPLEFAKQLGLAAIDWETLKQNPAKWLGKLAPTLVAAFFTAGGSVAVTRGAKLPKQLAALAKEIRRLEAMGRSRARIEKLRSLLDEKVYGTGGLGRGDSDADWDAWYARNGERVWGLLALATEINPMKGHLNCVRTTIAFELAMRARARGVKNLPRISALPGDPDVTTKAFVKMFGGKPRPVKGGIEVLQRHIAGRPDGTRGIVIGRLPNGLPHAVNTVNVNGKPVFIDTQTIDPNNPRPSTAHKTFTEMYYLEIVDQ